MKRMLNRQLSMAFEKWQAEAAQMKHEQETLKRAVMKLVKEITYKLASGGKAKVMDASGKRPSELGAGRATPRGELTALLKRHELLVLG